MERTQLADRLDESTITPFVGFLAMKFFIQEEFEITQSDDLRDILSSMAVATDGLPIDLGIWQSWTEAIEKARSVP